MTLDILYLPREMKRAGNNNHYEGTYSANCSLMLSCFEKGVNECRRLICARGCDCDTSNRFHRATNRPPNDPRFSIARVSCLRHVDGEFFGQTPTAGFHSIRAL